jgi:polygalacturonase
MALTKVTYAMIEGAVFNVLDFGAVGDGVANDQAACQAAINAAVAAGGGAVYFPSGTYILNSVASSDTTPNGLLIPDTGRDFSTNNAIMLI